MNANNFIKVRSIDDESTGFFFQSYDEKKSFVIATKHGICDLKSSCELYSGQVIDCCRNCTNQFDRSKIELNSGEFKLKIKNIYYEINKDIVLIEVSENSDTKLKINTSVDSNKYYAHGFMKSDEQHSRLVLDCPQIINNKIQYNLYSDPTPNLEEKDDSYYGISGSVVFTSHEKNWVAKGLLIQNGKHNDLIAEDLSSLNFESIDNFFECKVFDTTLFSIKIKNSLSEHFETIHTKGISEKLKLVLYAPRKTGYPHYDIKDICETITNDFYQIFMPKKGNINFIPYHAVKVIFENIELEPVNKILSARVAEAYLNAPHLYSTSLSDELYHHTHYLFINDGLDLAISNYCGHNALESNIKINIEHIISNVNNYQFSQNLLLERSFLDQNIDQEICDRIFDILFNYDGRISNFCLIYTLSMELFIESEFDNVNDYIISIINKACDKIDNTILKKLNLGLNLHIIVIPMNVENEIADKFLKDLDGGS
ncbi:hypothetical protein [Acinetobacter sp. YH12134]|uniref:hypothetical protein n=1 Tax=Acinetobacter sp. YH12134 TaxID=2601118 RepID=UPI0015D347FA|nr:hypothetical protein [Acinetobacter sp. YH12134]